MFKQWCDVGGRNLIQMIWVKKGKNEMDLERNRGSRMNLGSCEQGKEEEQEQAVSPTSSAYFNVMRLMCFCALIRCGHFFFLLTMLNDATYVFLLLGYI